MGAELCTVGEARQLLQERCFGFGSDNAQVHISPIVLRRLSCGGSLYSIPRGSRVVPNGYDTSVFHGGEVHVLVPHSWNVPRRTNQSFSAQTAALGLLSVLSPYEIAVMGELDPRVLASGMARTGEYDAQTHYGVYTHYMMCRSDGEMHYRKENGGVLLPEIGVLLGIRREVK